MNHAQTPGLSCRNLDITVPGRNLVLNLEIELQAGEVVAILGPNGVGKSLTLSTLAGLRPFNSGEILLGDESLLTLARRQIAQRLAFLTQNTDDVFPATVLDTVLIGRHPHIKRFQWESDADRAIALDSLAETGLTDLRDREVATLSGGERRRLAVAQVLAQSPAVFLLDEPTNHLDPQHQLDVLKLFRQRADAGAAVLVSVHDVNLAARMADRCLLLFGDGNWKIGTTDKVLTVQQLSQLYATTMESIIWRDRQLFVAAG